MKRALFFLAMVALSGCGGGANRESSDLTLTIGDRHVLINNGLADEIVDWIVVRSYPADDTEAAANDKRVRFEGDNAFVTLPDGTTEELRGSRLLFYLDEDGVEAHPIALRRENLDVLHTEPYDSVGAMIEALVELSMRQQYD